MPWALAALMLATIVAFYAGQRFRGTDSALAEVSAMPSQRGIVPAPDISSLTPAQRAERLYDRVMAAAERGRNDSVRFFMPMAIGAYEALGDLSVDQRYDLGRLAEVAGDARLASAQADTILRGNQRHLLGLVLASRAARMRGDQRAAKQYLDRLVSAQQSERSKQLPEYLVHQSDIDVAVQEARRGTLLP